MKKTYREGSKLDKQSSSTGGLTVVASSFNLINNNKI